MYVCFFSMITIDRYVVCSDLKQERAPVIEYMYSVNDRINALTALPAHLPIPKPGHHGGTPDSFGRKGFARQQRGGRGGRGEPPPTVPVTSASPDAEMVSSI
jgi:hypothetical protein